MAEVLLTRQAKDDIRDLDGSARKLVLKALRKLESDPDKRGAPLGSRAAGNLTGFRKLVVGDRAYRIVYRIEGDRVVVVWVIGARADNECYELAIARLRAHTGNPELMRELEAMLAAVREAGVSNDDG